MEFKISELEQESIDFDLQFKVGAIDFGEEAEQSGPLASSGRAEVLHEHRAEGDRGGHSPERKLRGEL
jgi:uncharacterized protein